MNKSPEFYGNSHYAETGLYYNISGGRKPVPSLEVEGDADWNICDQLCNISTEAGPRDGPGWLSISSPTRKAQFLEVLKWRQQESKELCIW